MVFILAPGGHPPQGACWRCPVGPAPTVPVAAGVTGSAGWPRAIRAGVAHVRPLVLGGGVGRPFLDRDPLTVGARRPFGAAPAEEHPGHDGHHDHDGEDHHDSPHPPLLTLRPAGRSGRKETGDPPPPALTL